MMCNEDVDTSESEEERAHKEDAINNLHIFRTWMAPNYKLNTLYKAFVDSFDVTYRCDLYEDICEFFNDDQMVTTNILFYWKVMIINLLKLHKKYARELATLQLDLANKTD